MYMCTTITALWYSMLISHPLMMGQFAGQEFIGFFVLTRSLPKEIRPVMRKPFQLLWRHHCLWQKQASWRPTSDVRSKMNERKSRCYIGNHFAGPLGCVNDTVLMAPSVQSLQTTADVSADLNENTLLHNGSGSQRPLHDYIRHSIRRSRKVLSTQDSCLIFWSLTKSRLYGACQ